MKLAARLSALYAVLLGVTVLIVILASSIALVFELWRFSGDVMVAKHEEARILVDQYRREGMSLEQAAPEIVNALSGIGLRVTVYDLKGRYLAGDKTLRPRVARPACSPRAACSITSRPADARAARDGASRSLADRGAFPPVPPDPTRLEPLSLTYVEGGYVGFAPSFPLLLVSLVPYWRIVLTIARRRDLALVVRRPALRAAVAAPDQRGERLAARARRRRLHAAPLRDGRRRRDRLAHRGLQRRRRERRDARSTTGVTPRNACASSPPTPAHELRTPLTVIAGYIDVLRRGAIEEPRIARQILATMSIEKEHMRGLIDRLMRLARLDSEAPPQIGDDRRRRAAAQSGRCGAALGRPAHDRLQRRRRQDDRRRSRRAGRSRVERDRERAEVRARGADPSARVAQQRPRR